MTAGLARKQAIAAEMARVRAGTCELLERVPEHLLRLRVHSFYSPVGWHFGHIGMTEEHWTVCAAMGGQPLDPARSFLFANVPENPKDRRVHLPPHEELADYLLCTRQAALDALDRADLQSASPLLADGYAWEFAIQHECQHQETIVELLQLLRQREGRLPGPAAGAAVLAAVPPMEMLSLPAGEFTMGCNDRHTYDNEKLEHCVSVQAFEMDRLPVLSGHWVGFMLDGGYQRKELWTDEGWAWREAEGVEMPEYWARRGEGFVQFGPDGARAIPADEPVSSIGCHEATAYARWIHKRLPTEEEWEYAAGYNAGREAEGADPLLLCTAVWQWTASPFLPYPGFEAFPYDGYSLEHMDGSFRVCRGGSWRTDRRIRRRSFRNWYPPGYRQGILGFRCAL